MTADHSTNILDLYIVFFRVTLTQSNGKQHIRIQTDHCGIFLHISNTAIFSSAEQKVAMDGAVPKTKCHSESAYGCYPLFPKVILILSFESTTCHIKETTIKEAMVQNMCFTKMCFYLPWGYNTTAKNTTRLVILARNTWAQRELNNRLAGPETLHLRVTVCRWKNSTARHANTSLHLISYPLFPLFVIQLSERLAQNCSCRRCLIKNSAVLLPGDAKGHVLTLANGMKQKDIF